MEITWKAGSKSISNKESKKLCPRFLSKDKGSDKAGTF